MSVQHLHALIDVLNVPAAYLMLRNILEDLVELLVYLDVARSFDSNLVLSVIFLYDYESTAKRRRYSLKKFRREFVKKLLRTGIDSESEQPLSADEYVNRFRKRNVPILGVKPSTSDRLLI